ncbi:TIR domain-containing protein [Paenalcaligenes sp. Me52]|uniref:toll/interleukin-1 receptor domain-containing protein n=1 Tax=Paenalcaligenes sp. Me52 TaxID=3392038 RepID=UPI003D2B6C4C
MEQKKVFISYSWDSNEHREWVAKLAEELERNPELHVFWDGYDLDSFIDKNLYMEESVGNADYTIVVATKKYFKKANEREGGVGIETYLNSAKHWEALLETKRTNSIVVLREEDSTPTYLKGHLYIDFTNDSCFMENVQELVKKILEKQKYKRPPKSVVQTEMKVYQLTKASEIIGIGARNRKCLISSQEGTDFSGGYRIKYELWETKSPALMHILALHNNINISQTLTRAVEMIIEKKIEISNLTILRPKEKRKNTSSIDKILLDKNKGSSFVLTEITYEEYVWNYCIDESFKSVQPPDAIDFYTTQELQSEEKTYESAVKHLLEELTNDASCIPQLVIGSGGIGKTSLCLSLAKELIIRHNENVLTVLIRSEDIRKYLDSTSRVLPEINTIYDLYVLQANHLGHSNLIDRKTFDLSIVSGNIAIIIDGLDELASIFKEKFDLSLFLDSISSHYKELGYGRVVLTSRDTSLINQEVLEKLDFVRYELLGFKESNYIKYLNRRFSAYENSEAICKKIAKKINSSLFNYENRIVPFFVDVISNIAEEELNEDNDQFGFELDFSQTPYPSLNEITDHIIYSIFDREKTRHKFNLETDEYVELFTYLNQEQGEEWDFQIVSETSEGLYGDNGRGIPELIKKNPLVKFEKNKIRFKYDFLHAYLNSLRLFQGLINAETGLSFAKCLSRPTIESAEVRDLVSFFKDGKDEFFVLAGKIISKFKLFTRDNTNTLERNIYINAIENLLSVAFLIKNSTKESFTNDVKEIYNATDTLDGLFIMGDLPALDFTNITVVNSRFRNYPKFLSSDFSGASFLYSEFISCHNDSYKKSSLLKANIDQSTCNVGDLKESIAMLSLSSEANENLIIEEARKFLESFYRNSGFRDNNKVHMRFSNHIPGLRPKAFHKLVSEGYLELSAEKEVDTFYLISVNFRSSVRKLINDGYKDSKMKKFLRFISG